VSSLATESKAWQRLRGKIAGEVFTAPRTCGDPHNQGHWPEVPHRVVNYLERNVLSSPWANTAVLLAAIMMARRFEVSSVIGKIVILHSRFTSLFACLGLARMEDWDAALHIPMYLSAEILPDDPQSIRQRFWVTYSSASKTMAQWLGTFPECQKPLYQQFILPVLSRLFVEGLVRQKEVTQQQQRTRKAETDAVVPRFAAIRAEAHFRYNRIARLRRAYSDALRSLKPGTDFPLTFSYEEGEDKERGKPAQERLWFRIWDRRSFVLAHADAYSHNAVATARHHQADSGAGIDCLNRQCTATNSKRRKGRHTTGLLYRGRDQASVRKGRADARRTLSPTTGPGSSERWIRRRERPRPSVRTGTVFVSVRSPPPVG